MKPKAPFRADHVGSLLRPVAVKMARQDHHEGRISSAKLRAIEDDCIRDLVKRQEAVGLQAATDGEIRRAYWHFDFLAGLDGVELIHGKRSIQFHGVHTKADSIAVTGRVGFPEHHPMLADFRYLCSLTQVTPKMTIPSPAVLHFRGGRNNISKEVYPELDAFFDDTAAAFADAIRAFYAAGCRYLQMDDTIWAYLCSEKEKQAVRERGEDPEGLAEIYARMINTALRARPADMVITTHVCRGNFMSSWISEGGYDPVARTLLQDTDFNAYFLEYDSDRAGGFEPLRFLPKGDKKVVLGLITSKSGILEDPDLIKRRIEEACRYTDLDQLCLSPQCGFASTEEGNLISEAEQWEKLRFVVKLANEIWKY